MVQKIVWGILAWLSAASAWAASERTLEVQTVPTLPTAWIVFEYEGERHAVNYVTGAWNASRLHTAVGEIPFGKGTFVRGVVRAPGYAPAVRLFDTGAGKVTINLERISTELDFAPSDGSAIPAPDFMRRMAELVAASPEGNPEARAVQSGMRLLRASQAAEVEAAVADATAVIDGGATGPAKVMAHATQALGRMELWRLAVASANGDDLKVSAARWNDLREATLRAARAWVESGTHDPRATKLCLSAEGTPAECGLSVDPMFR